MMISVAYTSAGSAVRILMDDGAVWHDDAALPPDTDIRRQLADWLADGNVISPFDPPAPTVPFSVSAYQAKASLMNAGIYDSAAAAANAAGGLVLLAWNTATEFQRTSPSIATLAVGLGLTEAQVDALFIAAAKITA